MKFSKLLKIITFTFIMGSVFSVSAQSIEMETEKARLKADISFLASDQLGGRQTGSSGELSSATYIRNEFKKNKLTLLGKDGFQEFSIIQLRIATEKCRFAMNSANGFINEVREKVEISDEATVGIYAWSKPDDFAQSLSEMINSDDRVNGEFYVAPTYNYLIKNKMRIKPFHIGKVSDSVFGLGTPEDLEIFLGTNLVLELRKSVTERLNQV